MNETIILKRFADIDLNDIFFNTLKEDYPGFEAWFEKKSKDGSKAYVQYTNSSLQAFLYLKNESGDLIAIYRTNDDAGPARYRSVITSICQIEEVKTNTDFATVEDFLAYANYYSIFDSNVLEQWYGKKNITILKMTYNVALTKRVTNGYMVDELKIAPKYWGFFQLTDEQFEAILKKGEVDESVIIN